MSEIQGGRREYVQGWGAGSMGQGAGAGSNGRDEGEEDVDEEVEVADRKRLIRWHNLDLAM